MKNRANNLGLASVFVAALWLSATPAGADPFAIADQLPVLDGDGATALIWSRSGECADAKSDVDKRVCKQVAAAISRRYAGESFRVFRNGHVTAGAFRARARSLPIVVDACLFCDDVIVSGQPAAVIGYMGKEGPGAPLKDTSLVFKNEQAAKTWLDEILPRVIGEFLVSVPADLAVTSGKDGLQAGLEVVAFRVFDPCTGEIVASQPKLASAPKNQAACDEGKAAVMAAKAAAEEAAKKAEPPPDDDSE